MRRRRVARPLAQIAEADEEAALANYEDIPAPRGRAPNVRDIRDVSGTGARAAHIRSIAFALSDYASRRCATRPARS